MIAKVSALGKWRPLKREKASGAGLDPNRATASGDSLTTTRL